MSNMKPVIRDPGEWLGVGGGGSRPTPKLNNP